MRQMAARIGKLRLEQGIGLVEQIQSAGDRAVRSVFAQAMKTGQSSRSCAHPASNSAAIVGKALQNSSGSAAICCSVCTHADRSAIGVIGRCMVALFIIAPPPQEVVDGKTPG
jgi:hypothetical protein